MGGERGGLLLEGMMGLRVSRVRGHGRLHGCVMADCGYSDVYVGNTGWYVVHKHVEFFHTHVSPGGKARSQS